MDKRNLKTPEKLALGARIRAARERCGHNQGELAKLLGIRQQSVAQWENGVAVPRPLMLEKLAATLKTTVQFLLVASQEQSGADLGQFTQIPVPRGRVSVRGTIRMSADATWNQADISPGAGHIEFYSPHGDAYALKVVGDALHPRIQSGEFVLVEPQESPQEGDEVVVALHAGTFMLRVLVWRRDGHTALSSASGARQTLADDEILYLHTISAIVKPSRFRAPPPPIN